MAKKLLIETSAAAAVLGNTVAAHRKAIREVIDGHDLYSSIYIRKEFVFRYVKAFIRLAFCIDHFGTLDQALQHLKEDFQGREVKMVPYAIALALKKNGAIDNAPGMAREFAHLAYMELKKFDKKFSRIINNTSGCSVGGKRLRIDFDNLFESLQEFVKSIDNVSDCSVNKFLKFEKGGRAQCLLDSEITSEVPVVKQLAALAKAKKWIDCKSCKKIGDAIIALEQPKFVVLVHIDKAFDALCSVSQRNHIEVPSERAVVSDALVSGRAIKEVPHK